MELIFRISLFIAGVINFAPSLLAFLPDRISKSYGITVSGANLELLLRHRAILFGIVGGLLFYSAFTKKYYELSTLIGLVSMASFLILFLLIGGDISKELEKVMKIDAVAIVILVIGFACYKIK